MSARIGCAVAMLSASWCAGQDFKPVILPVLDGDDIRFNHVFVGTGPAHSKAHRILQDHQGFLWFATADRLQRYDGYDVREYRQPLADPNVFIQGLFEDNRGTLWVSRDRGI
jgi:streptogramin lyase